MALLLRVPTGPEAQVAWDPDRILQALGPPGFGGKSYGEELGRGELREYSSGTKSAWEESNRVRVLERRRTTRHRRESFAPDKMKKDKLKLCRDEP